jgi:UDP-2,4-diacetamido-2,4,6-trideoxy-beta-L-altropyranose hydrolase
VTAPGIVFRCDAGPNVGLGHLMRCLALGEALRERGVRVAFALREARGNPEARVLAAGFAAYVAPAVGRGDERAPLGPADAERLHMAARRARASAVLVDHYGAGAAYLGAMRAAGLRLGVLDDRTGRDLGAAEWVLDPNLGADAPAADGVAAGGQVRLAGPAFAPLRPAFGRARAGLRRIATAGDGRVVITLGGGDTLPLATRVLELLDEVPRRLEVCCIAAGFPATVGVIARAGRHRVTLIERVRDPAPYFRWADLSINAGGSTCWELMCLGVPMLVLPLSPDQEPNAAAIEAAGCGRRLGPEEFGRLPLAVESLLLDAERRAEMSRRGMTLVDGRGAERAAESLLGLLAPFGESERAAG